MRGHFWSAWGLPDAEVLQEEFVSPVAVEPIAGRRGCNCRPRRFRTGAVASVAFQAHRADCRTLT